MPQILEGTWEEIAEHATELAGRRVRVTLLDEPFPTPNVGMLEALQRVAEIQEGMPESSGERTLEYIREARDGGMYGLAAE